MKKIEVRDDYETGYRKPPDHAKFKPGQSGNPSGRPKRKHEDDDLANLVVKELHRRRTVAINDKRKTVNALELIAKKLVQKSIDLEKTSIMLVREFMEIMLARDTAELRKSQTNDLLREYELKFGVKMPTIAQ